MNVFNIERPSSPWLYLFDEHRLAAGLGWQRLFRQPYQTLGAIFLMTISLALLIVFSLIFYKTSQWQSSFKFAPHAMIFSKNSLTSLQTESLYSDLSAASPLKNWRQIDSEDLLSDFLTKDERQTFAKARPAVFTVDYPLSHSLKEVVDLKNSLERHPLVDRVDVDMILHTKMTELLSFSELIITLLGTVLLSSVVITINYSIKLFMDRYQQEIAILYHLGASSDFIQRPYIYQGMFLGLLGSLSALLALCGLHYAFNPKIQSLLALYEYSWTLNTQDYMLIGLTLLAVIVFAIISALVSTRKWLSLFEHERLG